MSEFEGHSDDDLIEMAVMVVAAGAGIVMVVLKISMSLWLKRRSIVAHKNN
jgi:hypothetical protein